MSGTSSPRKRSNHLRKRSAPPASLTGDYARRKLRELDHAIVLARKRVVEDPNDHDAVHALRVAIRRLRTMLEATRAIFGKWRATLVRKAFAEVMRTTSPLRDEEVLQATLARASDAPAFVAWARARSRRTRELRHEVTKDLDRDALDRAHRLLDALLTFPIRPDRDRDLVDFARKIAAKAGRSVTKKSAADVRDAKALHELRIAYKRLRYLLELFQEVLPEPERALVTETLEGTVAFQKRLGDLHDIDVAFAIVNHEKELGARTKRKALSGLSRLRRKGVRKYLRLTPLDPLPDTRRTHAGPQKALHARRLL